MNSAATKATPVVTIPMPNVSAIDSDIAWWKAASRFGMNGWRAGTTAATAAPKLCPTPVRSFGLTLRPAPELSSCWACGCSSGGRLATISVGSRFSSELPNTVPAIASPTVPPIWRKNVRLLVATPSIENGTAFWTMIVNTDSVGPMPRPVTNIQRNIVVYSVVAVSWRISTRPMAMRPMPVSTSSL